MHVHVCMCIYKCTCEHTYTDINTHWYTQGPSQTIQTSAYREDDGWELLVLTWIKSKAQVLPWAVVCLGLVTPAESHGHHLPLSPRRQCYSDLQCAPPPALLSRDLFLKRVLIPGVRLPESAVPPVRKQDRGSAELEGPLQQKTLPRQLQREGQRASAEVRAGKDASAAGGGACADGTFRSARVVH